MSTSDVCIVNARVITMNDRNDEVDALCFRDGRVVEVGTREAVLAAAEESSRVIDAEGATVLPGLIDAHAHLELLAYAWEVAVDCRSSRVSSIDDIVESLRAKAADTPPGEWILGHGEHFQKLRLSDERYPDRFDLDRVSDAHPVIYRSSYHLNVFNSLGLRTLRVDKHTPDAPGGRIERDPDTSEPTGRTYDMYGPLNGPQASVPTLVDAMVRVQDKYLRVGVTSIGDLPLHSHGLDALLLMAAQGWAHLRATVYPKYPTVVKEGDFATRMLRERLNGINGDKIKLGGIKLFLDGGLTSGAAALYDDYPDFPGYRGELTYSDEEVGRLVKAIDACGYQVAMHAIGDRALDQAIGAIAALPEERRRVMRHRIEHAGNLFMTEERIEQLARFDIVPVPQPSFILTTALGYRKNLGEERTAGLMPFKSLLAAGLVIPGNSDAIGITPDQHNPFPAIQAAVTRRSRSGELVDVEEAVSVTEALKMYTRWAAYALGWEETMGSLEPGKVADFILLDRDPREIPSEEIGELQVQSTWIGGDRVYAR